VVGVVHEIVRVYSAADELCDDRIENPQATKIIIATLITALRIRCDPTISVEECDPTISVEECDMISTPVKH
jgi:hypothetical protein